MKDSRTGVNGLPLTGKSFPEFQCALCHDWFRGKDGSDISDKSDGFFFLGTPFTSQSDVRTSGWRVPGEEDGVFSGGGAVMAPLRRAAQFRCPTERGRHFIFFAVNMPQS